jgi:hypothetical protein
LHLNDKREKKREVLLHLSREKKLEFEERISLSMKKQVVRDDHVEIDGWDLK